MEVKETVQRKRNRKTREDRLAELAEKRRQIELRAKQQLESLEIKMKRLADGGRERKAQEQERRAMVTQVFQLVPDWDPAMVIGAVARVQRELADNPALRDEVRAEGNAHQQQSQQKRGRRGRKPKVQSEG